jgi:RNA polymerase subunit RPABC4/transcription elongation factor Spt4
LEVEMSSGSNSPFRFLFWGLVLVFLLSLSGPLLLGLRDGLRCGWPGIHFHSFALPPVGHWLIGFLPLLLIAVFVTVVGSLVYRDAERHGMDPWLWASVAVFVPAFIGVVIYLIMRSSIGRRCPQCGRGLQAGFQICPYCGHRQEAHCPQCQTPIAADWKLCPQCGEQLGKTAGESPAPEGGDV